MPIANYRLYRCAVAGIEGIDLTSTRAFDRHTHDQFGIGVVVSGAQKSASGRGMVEAGQGDVITFNPGEVHDGVPIDDKGRSWRMLYFAPDLIADALRDMTEGRTTSGEFELPVVQDPALAERFLQLFLAMTEASADLRRQELLTLVQASVLGRWRDSDRPQMTPGIAQAKALIDDDPLTAHSLADLAKVGGLSRFQVLRAFAKATGLTPHAYLVQRRTDLARRLIASGTPLAEAAAGAGFADQSHMNRVFARRYGYPPGAYAAAVN
ncbi:AraC family ligand binding domain-containing protein [Lacibacterium aquatile]|uniref:AraC family ligand binding domain-containing protein n=1 Tax=Lacibacterium aquatile TaxID=1168082 RepID=A0ABW5DU39_9PROT